MDFICAVRVPGGVNCKGNVYGHRIRSRSHGNVMKKDKILKICSAVQQRTDFGLQKGESDEKNEHEQKESCVIFSDDNGGSFYDRLW